MYNMPETTLFATIKLTHFSSQGVSSTYFPMFFLGQNSGVLQTWESLVYTPTSLQSKFRMLG